MNGRRSPDEIFIVPGASDFIDRKIKELREHHEKVHREISFNVIKQTHGAVSLSENDITYIAERVVPGVGVLTNYQAHLDFYKHSLKHKISQIVNDEM